MEVDFEARRDVIWSAAVELAAGVGGRVPTSAGLPGGLIDEVVNLVGPCRFNPVWKRFYHLLKLKDDEPISNFAFNFNLRPYSLVESPTPILGSFDPAFLALPKEVLVMAGGLHYTSPPLSQLNLCQLSLRRCVPLRTLK